jgi:hypothetical protein
MGPEAENRRGPVHPVAVAALAVAVVAAGLALYGSFLAESHLPGSRLNVARGQPGLEALQASPAKRVWVQIGAYFVPFALGLTAALLGGDAMRRIDADPKRYSGSLPAVFAIMVGGLAAVVAGCMIVAAYGWRYVPAAYTG